jgi:hypothetical protein
MIPPSLIDALERARSSDGGFGSMPDASSEAEATALAGIALGDADASAWLVAEQRADGSCGTDTGAFLADVTPLASLALPDGAARERALEHVVAVRGANAVGDGGGDPPYGWAWTTGAHGWTEPTAWGVLALRRGRPGQADRIRDGLDALRVRACVGGGWNYGTAEGFGVIQPPFVQTTAVALFATAGADVALTAAGLDVLARSWRKESMGLLSLATATAALRALDHDDAVIAAAALRRLLGSVSAPDTVALAWAAIALGSGIERLRA